MPFDPFHIDLPVVKIISELRQQLIVNNTIIIAAPPGAGKSTLVPLALMDEPWLEGKKILMLEPRRLATSTVANRMAQMLGEPVGKTVGYRIRFENRISSLTRIEVLTEGILTRMLHQDNALEDVGMVIFDEFHERNLYADIAMAFCRESQLVLRPNLRIALMSATMDMNQLSSLLNAPIVESKGKQYPVEINYTDDAEQRILPEMAAQLIIKAVQENEGDILGFLPGQGEIQKCDELLRKRLPEFAIYPLYGFLPPSQQYYAIMPHPQGKRKIVLATSIAETSLTIEGISVVVDAGFSRVSRFEPRSGLSKLTTVRVSQDSADQRAGRAGRLGPGVCYRMWTKATHERLSPYRTPEILDADLAPLVLDMAQWGLVDPLELTWLTPPPLGAYSQAVDTLHQLNALENSKITTHGKQIHQIPCHPRIAHMLLMAKGNQKLALATDLAALLEERDPMDKEAGVDINRRIEALRRHRRDKGSNRKFEKIETIACTYRKILKVPLFNGSVDPFDTGILLANAYPERIASARPGVRGGFQLSNGKVAFIDQRDELAHEGWLAIALMDAGEDRGKIYMASPLNPKDLAPLVKEKYNITWDTKKGGLVANKELRIGSIILQVKKISSPDIQLRTQAISEAIKREGKQLLSFEGEVSQLQNRILSLQKWNPIQEWPKMDTETLLATNGDWLSPYLHLVNNPEDLKNLDLIQILKHSLDYGSQNTLDQLAPVKIQVPSGSWIKLDYQANGEPPVLAVRLQEVFGWEGTPLVNQGKNPVILHLLSPGFKLVQITSDLRNFWVNTYFEVRKEMKRRYPKHAWPDDPLNAEAVRGARKKGSAL